MIVDAHTHVFPPDVVEQRARYVERDEGFRAVYANNEEPLATADELLASMEGAGIERSVICGFSWSDGALCRMHSDYLLEAASESDGRLTAFCTLHPAEEGGRKEMERLAARGALGLGELRPELQGFGLVDSEEADLLAWGAAAFDLTVMFHATLPLETPAGARTSVEQIARFSGDFPGVNVVAAHLGGGLPFYALMPEVKEALETTFFDTAGLGLLYRPDALGHVVDLVGPGKVLFGSDFPRVSQGDALEQVRRAGLALEDEERVLGGNVRRLLRL